MKIKSFLVSVVVGFIIGGVTLAEASTVYENPVAKHDTFQIAYEYNDDVRGEGYKQRSSFTYNDGYFLQDATKLNGEVAKMSVALAAAAYDKDSIDSIISDMGFSIINTGTHSVSYDDSRLSLDDNDHVAYTIARKQIDGYTVYCVPIKGTGKNAEWYSDFNLGEGDDHLGFYNAAVEVNNELVDFINSDGTSLSKTIVLLTGHSRGAAVTNIIAAWLDKKSQIPDAQIFGYAFACPAVSVNFDHSLKNIYNFNNPGDLVTLLPMEDWGYGRNGTDINVYGGTLPVRENVYYQFKRNIGIDCRSEDSPITYLNLIKTFIPDKKTFMTSQYQAMFRLIAFCISEGRNTTPGEVLAYNDYEVAKFFGITISKLKRDIANGSITSNVYELVFRYNVNIANSYIELISACDGWLKQSDDDLDYESIRDSSAGRQINDLVQVEIHTRSDIALAKSKMSGNLTDINKYAEGNIKAITLFISESGNIRDSIGHGHSPIFYVSLVNALFFGYRGWAGFIGSDVNLSRSASFDAAAYDSIMDIGEECFSDCLKLKSVQLPKSLNSISKSAFYWCEGLFGEVEIPTGVTSIGESAFCNCTNISGKLEIPEGVTKIEKDAFFCCQSVEELVIPESVTTIDGGAFAGFRALKKLTIPCYTTFDGSGDSVSFSSCESLEYVSITGSGASTDFGETTGIYPENVPWVISNVDVLEIDVSEGITRIGDHYFDQCWNLKKINIPSTVTEIGDYAYQYCNADCSDGGCKLVIPSGITSIGDSAFAYCKQATGDLNLPEGLTHLGEYAFYRCENLTGEVVIPDGVTEIKDFSFTECRNIEKVTIHNGVISVGDYAFSCCDKLRDLTIPGTSFVLENDTVFKPDKYVSGGIEHVRITGQGEMIIAEKTHWIHNIYDLDIRCSDCTPWYLSNASSIEIEIDEGITTIQDYAFANTKVSNIDIPSTVTTIGTGAYFGCKAEQKLVIPNGVKNIGPGAFAYCSKLTGLEISSSVRNIGESAFYECENISGKLEIPEGISRIEKNVFSSCHSIEELVIPESVIMIGGGAFAGFRALKKLTIPCYTTFDGSGDSVSFSSCEALEYVSITGTGSTIDFGGTTGRSYEYAPWVISKADSLEVELAEGITRIGDSYFRICTNLKEINIPSTVTEIGDHAYQNCNTSNTVEGSKIVIPAGVTSIGAYAFEYCIHATGDLKLPDGLTYLGESAFCQCENLTGDLVIPEGLTEIKDSAFSCCSGLESLTIPSGVKSIGNLAFSYCSGIKNITMPCDVKYVTSGEYYSFNKCSAIDHATITHNIVVDEEVAPDCINTGLTEGSHCSACGKVFVAQEEIPTSDHTPVTDDAVAPDCTHTGLTEGSHCSVCGEVLVAQETVSAKGHTPVTDPAVEPTYTETGLTEGSHCSVCGEILVAQEVVPVLTPEKIGWIEEDGAKYYYNVDGVKMTGWQKIDGSWYYLDPSTGAMLTGWQKSGSSWYYMDPGTGIMKTGWVSISGKWYYMNSSGVMQTGWQKISGIWYYFESSGAMATGWKQLSDKWYYFDRSGTMASGWKQISGTWYYFESSGAMVSGWKQIGGTWYYFEPSGAMAKNWKQIGGSWYYFGSSGAMVTGWKQISGKWYYFYDSGKMATNTIIDGYKIGKDGVMV